MGKGIIVASRTFRQDNTKKLEGRHFVVKLIEADFYIDHVSPDHLRTLKCLVLGRKKLVEKQFVDYRLSLFKAFS